MLQLSQRWTPRLVSQPETGMGYQIATVSLRDGRHFDQVLIDGNVITKIRGLAQIPFTEAEITDIVVTHDKRGLIPGYD
jgi:hypothetical protein